MTDPAVIARVVLKDKGYTSFISAIDYDSINACHRLSSIFNINHQLKQSK